MCEACLAFEEACLTCEGPCLSISQCFIAPLMLALPPAQVCLGWSHAVGLDCHGRVWCWGSGRYGQLGVLPAAATAGAAGADSTAAAVTLEPVSTSGSCVEGAGRQAGGAARGEAGSSAVPELVHLPGAAVDVAAGSEHSVAALADGSVWCWGWGEHGQLGLGSTCDCSAPRQVAAAVASIRQVAAAGAATYAW